MKITYFRCVCRIDKVLTGKSKSRMESLKFSLEIFKVPIMQCGVSNVCLFRIPFTDVITNLLAKAW